jgi:hypothetical protein
MIKPNLLWQSLKAMKTHILLPRMCFRLSKIKLGIGTMVQAQANWTKLFTHYVLQRRMCFRLSKTKPVAGMMIQAQFNWTKLSPHQVQQQQLLLQHIIFLLTTAKIINLVPNKTNILFFATG